MPPLRALRSGSAHPLPRAWQRPERRLDVQRVRSAPTSGACPAATGARAGPTRARRQRRAERHSAVRRRALHRRAAVPRARRRLLAGAALCAETAGSGCFRGCGAGGAPEAAGWRTRGGAGCSGGAEYLDAHRPRVARALGRAARWAGHVCVPGAGCARWRLGTGSGAPSAAGCLRCSAGPRRGGHGVCGRRRRSELARAGWPAQRGAASCAGAGAGRAPCWPGGAGQACCWP